MRQPVPTPPPSLASVAARCGFRRVHHVSVRTTGDRTTATATGVLRRYPVTVPVSLATAARLAAAGAPLRIDRSGSAA